MAVRTDFVAGEVLAAQDLDDTFASKPTKTFGTAVPSSPVSGDLFFDTTTTPPSPKFYDGAVFQGIAGGKILQVVSTTKTDTFTTTSNTFAQITGLTATITPSSLSSKIFIFATLSVGSNSAATAVASILRRDGTLLSRGNSEGSRNRSFAANSNSSTNYNATHTLIELDSPNSISSLVYDAAVTNTEQTGVAVFVNRSQADGNSTFIWRTASNITVMEVSA